MKIKPNRHRHIRHGALHKAVRSVGGSHSVRMPAPTTTSADRRWPLRETVIPLSCLWVFFRAGDLQFWEARRLGLVTPLVSVTFSRRAARCWPSAGPCGDQ